jgi:hypothetical protein
VNRATCGAGVIACPIIIFFRSEAIPTMSLIDPRMDAMSQEVTNVIFRMTSPKPRAWLVLKGEHQESRVIEMQQKLPSLWSASEDLIPDEYLCRYYCGDDNNVSYYGPAQVNGGIDSGMDTLLSVRHMKEREDMTFA